MTRAVPFPAGDAHCTMGTYLRLAPPDAALVRAVSLRVAPLHAAAVRKELTAAKIAFRPVAAPAGTAMTAYELTPKPGADGADLAAAIRFVRPTFTEAVPAIRLDARCGRAEFPVDATTATDPRRFTAELLTGAWAAETGSDVVLTAAVVSQVFPNEPATACVGRALTLTFTRDRVGNEFDRAVEVPVRLVGVAVGGAFVSESLAADVALWAAGKVIYSAERKTFEPPLARYERGGFARCNLDVADPDRLEEVVTWLQADGYPVAHRLGELEGQRKFGRVLAAIVFVLVGGYLLSGAITVFASNAQQVAGKVYEIAVLRSLGMSGREVVGLFAFQGLLTGLVAFAVGAGVAMTLEPIVSGALVSDCGVPNEALPTRLADAAHLPLFGLALAVAVVASTVGAAVPAARAARLDLVDSMRRVG